MSENKMTADDFVGIFKVKAETLGFWTEQYKATILKILERGFNPNVIKEYGISEIIPHGNEFLIHWYKRIIPLTDEQLKEMYD